MMIKTSFDGQYSAPLMFFYDTKSPSLISDGKKRGTADKALIIYASSEYRK